MDKSNLMQTYFEDFQGYVFNKIVPCLGWCHIMTLVFFLAVLRMIPDEFVLHFASLKICKMNRNRGSAKGVLVLKCHWASTTTGGEITKLVGLYQCSSGTFLELWLQKMVARIIQLPQRN